VLKPSLISLLAVATSAMLCSMPPESQAREQHRLLVVGNNDDLSIVHPAPQYPYDGQRMRIQGDVQVRVQVDHGRMVSVSAIRKFTLSGGRF
jgi:outer membrane biosynthesis protein TonB